MSGYRTRSRGVSRISRKRRNRPKSFYIKDMLEKYLDEYEEAYLALERISEKNARYYTSKEVKKLLEL